MAPRTRIASQREHAIVCNSRGFAALPTELLRHVASYIQGSTIPWHQGSPLVGQRDERRDALRALCQLCHSLRAALLPLIWQSLEAYTLIRGSRSSQVNAVRKELLGQLRVVSDVTQPYASYIRVITIAIFSRFANKALKELAHAMTLMPNLHTIQIMCGTYGGSYGRQIHAEQFRNAFAGHVFPSVRRVIFPAQAGPTFGCFPEVVEVFVDQTDIHDFCRFIDNMIPHCHKVETFGWQEYLMPRYSDLVVEKLPNLRRVEYGMIVNHVNEITQLFRLKNLEKITLVDVGDSDPEEVMQMIAAAVGVIRGSSQPNKCLEVVWGGARRTIDLQNLVCQ